MRLIHMVAHELQVIHSHECMIFHCMKSHRLFNHSTVEGHLRFFSGWGVLLIMLQRILLYMNRSTHVHDFYLEFYAWKWNSCPKVYVSSPFLCQVFQNFVPTCFPTSSFWEFVFASTRCSQTFKHCDWRVWWEGCVLICVWLITTRLNTFSYIDWLLGFPLL